MSFLYISIREQRVKDLTDKLPTDQQKMVMYAEMGDNFNMAQSNAEAFKSLNTHSICAIKMYKGKSHS